MKSGDRGPGTGDRRFAPGRGPGSLVPGPALAFALAFSLVSCASSQSPPGGPPDALPPEIERTTPDSAATGVRPDRVVFELNEVVSERPQGAASLTSLFLVSPRDGEPRVEWKRDRLTVRPRRSWRPNTVYTVTMLPGLTDLRGNVRREGATLVFSTGPTIPNTLLRGIVFDWPANRTAVRALVQAITVEDTTISYITVADSAGRFAMPHLPPGRYVVRAAIDQNSNRVLDRREAWDSVSIAFTDSARVELLAFVHDTIGPRISNTVLRDSTIRVTFDKPLDPAQELGVANFRLVALPDSAPVAIARVVMGRAWDEAEQARARARADSARQAGAARDTTRGPAIPPGVLPGERAAADTAATRPDSAARPSRPAPQVDVVLVLADSLRPGASYRLRAVDVRNLLGAARTSDRTIAVPRPPAPDTTRRAPSADSAGTPTRPPVPPPDTTRPPGDLSFSPPRAPRGAEIGRPTQRATDSGRQPEAASPRLSSALSAVKRLQATEIRLR